MPQKEINDTNRAKNGIKFKPGYSPKLSHAKRLSKTQKNIIFGIYTSALGMRWRHHQGIYESSKISANQRVITRIRGNFFRDVKNYYMRIREFYEYFYFIQIESFFSICNPKVSSFQNTVFISNLPESGPGVGVTGYAVTCVTVEPVGYASFFCEFT